MERQHLIKEICDLAERIKGNAYADTNQLLADVTKLYEMAILLKHVHEVKANGHAAAPEITSQKEEEKNPAKQVMMDLFSSAPPPPETPSRPAEPVEAKPLQHPDKSIVEKLNHQRVADLKAVIGINEKFQFINELFDGNMKEYSVAIDQINNFSSLGEAVNYLTNLKGMYKWKEDNLIAKNFEDLVERKFF